MSGPRVALVHDWLTGMRGGERVLEAICELFPGADIYTLVHRKGSVSAAIERHPIRTSLIQRLPFATTRYPRYLPLFPFAIEQLSLDAYDLVISSSHCAAKSVIVPGRARHLCYCHSPMRYAWDQFDAYFGPRRVGATASRWLYRPMLSRLARWDAATSGRVHRFVANSAHVAGRIRRYYNREAAIVYPPVDTVFNHPADVAPESHFLIVSALVPYKRIELAIEACDLAHVPLKIVGDGPERPSLERAARGRAEFLGRLGNDQVRALYRRAGVVLLPGEEDFGIVPLEAQACGRPVVALGRGGSLETVIPGSTGLLVDEPSAAAFAGAIDAALRQRFDGTDIRRHAERFGRERFGDEIEALVRGSVEAQPR